MGRQETVVLSGHRLPYDEAAGRGLAYRFGDSAAAIPDFLLEVGQWWSARDLQSTVGTVSRGTRGGRWTFLEEYRPLESMRTAYLDPSTPWRVYGFDGG